MDAKLTGENHPNRHINKMCEFFPIVFSLLKNKDKHNELAKAILTLEVD